METTNRIELASKSNLALNGRNSLSVSNVIKVKTTEPTRVVALLDNCSIVIVGVNLSVQNLSLASGVLEITGIVSSITYGNEGRRKFSFRNMFK